MKENKKSTEILLEDPKLDPNAKCRSINNGKETEATLLHAAVKADNELAVRKLLEKGADVNAKAVLMGQLLCTITAGRESSRK